MLSLTQFRKHIFSLFLVMKGTGQTFEVVHHNVVYDVSVRRTQKVSNLNRAKRTTSHDLVAVNTSECPECQSITFNGVCMNTKCLSVAIPGEEKPDHN